MAEIELHHRFDIEITRLVIRQRVYRGYNTHDAKKVLEWMLEQLPKNYSSRYLLTCGGFIGVDLPEKLAKVKDINKVNPREIDTITQHAESICRNMFGAHLLKRLALKFDHLSLGIDLWNEQLKRGVELVSLIALQKNKYHWTGKFHPVKEQEKTLISIPIDWNRIVECEQDKVLLLGCHDLSAFNPRCQVLATNWRKKNRDDIQRLVRKNKPTIVLQHPHNTTNYKTWSNCWGFLAGKKPLVNSITSYASGIRYAQEHEKRNMTLEDVCKHTTKGNVTDIIFCEVDQKKVFRK